MEIWGCHGYYSICPPDFDFCWLSAAVAPVPEVAPLRMCALPMCFSKLSETLLPVVVLDCDSAFPFATEQEATGLEDDDITMPSPLLEPEVDVPPCWTVCFTWLSFTFAVVSGSVPAAWDFGTVGTDAEGLLITLRECKRRWAGGWRTHLGAEISTRGHWFIGNHPCSGLSSGEETLPIVHGHDGVESTKIPTLLLFDRTQATPAAGKRCCSTTCNTKRNSILRVFFLTFLRPKANYNYVNVSFISCLTDAHFRQPELL